MEIILQVLLFAVSSIALASAGLVIHTYAQCKVALTSFKKQSNGMPLLDELRPWLGNHAILPVREQLCKFIGEEFARSGSKTIGWLFGRQFCALTIDLNLIRKYIVDEPNEHINRVVSNVPVREFEQGILLLRDDKWRKLRRYFAPAFKPTKFKTPNVRQEIESSIGKLIGQIERQLNESQLELFDMDELAHKYSLDLIFSCFYKQYNLIDFNARPKCEWTRRVDDGLEAFQVSPFVKLSMIFPRLTSTIDWFNWHFHSLGVWRRSVMHFVKLQTKLGLEARKQVREFRASNCKFNADNFTLKDGETQFKRNMMDTVVDYYLDGKLTKDEFFNSSSFMVSAADKTVTDCLVYTLYQLAVHQDVQTRLRKAVGVDGAEAEYLSWVVNESLRLRPPASLTCSRTVTHDFKLDNGHVLPAHTFVVCCAHTIHRLKEYWGEDADEFKPDRWQDTSHHHPMQFLPFGAGPRGCPGKEFALHTMKLALVALLLRYKFHCEPKSDIDIFDSPFLILILPKSPTHLTIRRVDADD